MSPPRRSAMVETDDHSPASNKLAPMAANPNRITIMPPHLCDNSTTITKTVRTSVSATIRAMGSPFATSGAARKTAQSSRTSSAVGSDL